MAIISVGGAVVFAIVALAVKILMWYMKESPSKNPFEEDSRRSVQPLEIDTKKRDAVLKQGFTKDKIPSELDAIIVGSGPGGLVTAALMAKAGKKVLVLEQHDQAGGCCHTYIEKGYEFDVGIHYIGELNRPTMNKTLIDQLTEGQLQWADLDDNFDIVAFDKPGEKLRQHPIMKGADKWKDSLKKQFPEESQDIDKIFETINEVRSSHFASILIKVVPYWLANFITNLGLEGFMSKYWSYNCKTVKETLEELTSNQELRDIFAYNFGDYGTVPSRANFPMQVLLLTHYFRGASYPVGGASEIAFHLIPVIEKAGGKVLVRAPVSKILTDEDGKVCGVQVNKGSGSDPTSIPARTVISDAGFFNTMERLLPNDVARQSRLWPLVKRLPHSAACMSIFVGLDAPAEKLDILDKKNMWVYTDTNIDKLTTDYMALSREEALEKDVPMLFISFPSTKDPEWETRYPGKTTVAIIALANYEWFKEWKDGRVMKRGDEYEHIKKVIGQKMIDQTCKLFPKIEDHIDYVSIGSPVTNNFYIAAPQGEIYGLDHNVDRFSAKNTAKLRAETDIPGLFLTGQDILSCGFTGAMYGGLLSAGAVLERNIYNDLRNLHKSIKKKEKNE